MLILSTYRVTVHPSYLRKVFSFVIFIKDRYAKPSLPKKAEILEACLRSVPWVELKSHERTNWDLFTKYSSPKSREQTNIPAQLCCCPGKTNFIHCSLNAGFFGKLKKVISPSQPKTLRCFVSLTGAVSHFGGCILRRSHFEGCIRHKGCLI